MKKKSLVKKDEIIKVHLWIGAIKGGLIKKGDIIKLGSPKHRSVKVWRASKSYESWCGKSQEIEGVYI